MIFQKNKKQKSDNPIKTTQKEKSFATTNDFPTYDTRKILIKLYRK